MGGATRGGISDSRSSSEFLFLRLYGPRFSPFFLSLRTPFLQVAVRLDLIHRWQGRPSSHFLQADAQFVQAILTCLRFGFAAGSVECMVGPWGKGDPGCPGGGGGGYTYIIGGNGNWYVPFASPSLPIPSG